MNTWSGCLLWQCCENWFSVYKSTLRLIHHRLGTILVKQNKSPFKGRYFKPSLILSCVCRYCRYQLSYRDLEEMMRERGLSMDHTTVWRWVQRYAPEITRTYG